MLDIKTSNSIVAENLKNIISQKSLKQISLAEKAGFTAQEFNDMLNGRRLMRAVDIASILMVLESVGVSANDLFRMVWAEGERGGDENKEGDS